MGTQRPSPLAGEGLGGVRDREAAYNIQGSFSFPPLCRKPFRACEGLCPSRSPAGAGGPLHPILFFIFFFLPIFFWGLPPTPPPPG